MSKKEATMKMIDAFADAIDVFIDEIVDDEDNMNTDDIKIILASLDVVKIKVENVLIALLKGEIV